MKNLYRFLAGREYPGRGICIGLSPDRQTLAMAYWIMGRSENSRNRIFEALPDGSGIRTCAADPVKLKDPHLIIYSPVRTWRHTAIITNGDQTDTIYQYMEENNCPGYSFEAALASRTFEDDAPNWTPRISAAADMRTGSYKLSILKSSEGNPAGLLRQTFDIPFPLPGRGHLITTYVDNGSPLPSFTGEPVSVTAEDAGSEEFARKLWAALNADNRVSLFVRQAHLADGSYHDEIINQYSRKDADHE